MDSISWELVEDQNGNGTPNYADVVKPVIETATPRPWVRLQITNAQGETDTRWQGMFDGALGDPDHWPLYGSQYDGGPAEATFTLWDDPSSAAKSGKGKGHAPTPLARVSFHVDA